jgi:hypothetical protein
MSRVNQNNKNTWVRYTYVTGDKFRELAKKSPIKNDAYAKSFHSPLIVFVHKRYSASNITFPYTAGVNLCSDEFPHHRVQRRGAAT